MARRPPPRRNNGQRRRVPIRRRPLGGAFTPPVDPPMRNQAPWSWRVVPFTSLNVTGATIYSTTTIGNALRGYLGITAASENLEMRVRKITVWATATVGTTVAPFVRMDVADLRRTPNTATTAGAEPQTQINALHTSTDQGTLNRPARVGYAYRPYEMLTLDETNPFPIFITSSNQSVQVYVDVLYRFLPPPPVGDGSLFTEPTPVSMI